LHITSKYWAGRYAMLSSRPFKILAFVSERPIVAGQLTDFTKLQFLHFAFRMKNSGLLNAFSPHLIQRMLVSLYAVQNQNAPHVKSAILPSNIESSVFSKVPNIHVKGKPTTSQPTQT
jgi:hypothetical protein